MPDLFVIGDSISMQYGPHLQAMLGDAFGYSRKGLLEQEVYDLYEFQWNGGDSARVREYLPQRIEQGLEFDWLLLNCGLHDLKRDRATDRLQVPLEAYRENLQAILAAATAHFARVVWVRTTPVDDEMHKRSKEFYRLDADVVAYNAAADAIVAAAGAASIDLYGFTKRLDGELYCDHVHFHEPVRRLQAAWIAGHLTAACPGGAPGSCGGGPSA